jgi:ABC-type transporter Mla subunit MlaD
MSPLDRYRPTMHADIVHSWAADAQAELDARDATIATQRAQLETLREGMKRLAGMLSTTAAVLERDKHCAAEIVRTAQRLASLHQTNDGSDDEEGAA